VKALVFLFLAAGSFIAWKLRQRSALARFREIDAGELCVACGSREVVIQYGNACCAACRYTISLQALRRATISREELSDATRLDMNQD
jgi:hypothetical protein